MASLALRNLFHDRVRLVVTLTGIVFSIVLIIIQVGLYLGFKYTISTLIDNANADLWVSAAGIPSIDLAVPIKERKRFQVLAVPGVAEAENYIIAFSTWKLPDGRKESIEVVGFNPDKNLGSPWNLIEGSVEELKQPNTVVIDEFYKKKLGVSRIGDIVEIADRRARVVGFTRGIRSFTTAPHAFTWEKNAFDYSPVREDETVFILVKAAAGADLAGLRQRIKERVPDLDVFTTAEFAAKTQNYWLYDTGAGVSVLIAAALGLVVGLVVVAQTIYASTMDHVREYGTLKAMGATNAYIFRVIIKQAVASAAMGYGMAMAIALPIVHASANSSALILLPNEFAIAMFGISVLMCVSASLVSIRKVVTIDPAMVFKG
ncbi:MAG: ABC transporter permease [Bryobacteraceae bacterium]